MVRSVGVGRSCLGLIFTIGFSLICNHWNTLKAQLPGDLDPNFEKSGNVAWSGGTSLRKVTAVVATGSGKVLIGGIFDMVRGGRGPGIAILNLDGSADAGFNSPAFSASNRSIAVQSDGKVLIAPESSTAAKIYRIHGDGRLDTTFDTGTGVNSFTYSLEVQMDGKVLIGGSFTSYNGTSSNRIARLHSDGRLDTTFDAGTGPNLPVYAIAVQADGKVLICGAFSSFNGTSRNRVARLNSDGSLDTSFNPGTGTLSAVRTIEVQADGKVLIGGAFTSFNGTTRNRIARLNSDGSLDATFNPGTGADDEVRAVAMQADGKIIIGGMFTSYNGTAQNRIARINGDGSLDTSFNPGTGADGAIYSVAVQVDGKVLIGGEFGSYDGTLRTNIARVNTNGSLDLAFNPDGGPNMTVETIAQGSDGKTLIAGTFSHYSALARSGLARLDGNGSLDTSFNPGTGTNDKIRSMTVHADGKVLIGGLFTSFNGTPRNRIARLNSDGTSDTSFNPGSGADGDVSSMAMQPDGKLLIGGRFTLYSGVPRNRITRLNTDGSLDTSFDPGSGADGEVRHIMVQADGKVLIGGSFNNYNGVARGCIARLNSNGSLDTSFSPGSGANADVLSMALQPDNKVLIGGNFTSFDGIERSYIARLNSNGSLDTSFSLGLYVVSNEVQSIVLQPDGRVIAVSNYSTRFRFVRLNRDGSHDPSLSSSYGVNNSFNTSGTVYAMVAQPNGKLLIGGDFPSYKDSGHPRLVRILGQTPPAISSPAPNVSISPGDTTVALGGGLTFTATVATGIPPFTYQWRKNGAIIAKATNATLALTNIQRTQEGVYDVVVKNGHGVDVSNPARLSLPPVVPVTNAPESTDVNPAGTAIFTVDVPGAMTWQWLKNGTPIKGAITSTLNVPNVDATSAGLYSVIVTTPNGKVTTAPAQLRVNDSGLLIYKLTGTGKAYEGTGSVSAATNGYLVLDRTGQRGGLILGGKHGNQNIHSLEVHEDLHNQSTGPVPTSQTVVSELVADEFALWLNGADALLTLSKTDKAVGPARMKGYVNSINIGPALRIEAVTLSLTVDAVNSAPARLYQETVEQALSRLSQDLQAKGSALVE